MTKMMHSTSTVVYVWSMALCLGAVLAAMRMEAQSPPLNRPTEMPLHYLIKQPRSSSSAAPLLILLHGYGSNEHDLFALAPQVPDEWIVVAVRGPKDLTQGRYAWYDARLEEGQIRVNFAEEEVSRKFVLRLIDDLQRGHAIDSRRVVVAGFSQGANLAQAVALSAPERVSGFGVFSGRWVPEFRPVISEDVAKHGQSAFIAHGSLDNMLPLQMGIDNVTQLQAMGVRTTWSTDTSAHTISPKQFSDFLTWLSNR